MRSPNLTPVLIAARDEASHISDTLTALPKNCSPTVIVNGCSDVTADIVRQFGDVALIVQEEAGKLPAIQAGLRSLGKRATEPLIFLDADTRPLLGGSWVNTLRSSIKDTDTPAFIVGPIIFDFPDPVSKVVKSAMHGVNQWRSRSNPDSQAFTGRNTIVNFNGEVLEEVLALPHIWPGEDIAIKDIVVEHGGHIDKLPNPGAVAMTSAERYPTIFQRAAMSKQEVAEQVNGSYLAEAAPGSIPYSVYKQQRAELQAAQTAHYLEKAA